MNMPITLRVFLPLLGLSACAILFGACTGTGGGKPKALAEQEAHTEKGYVFYLDGVGGETAGMNWSERVKQGLLDGGFQGTGEVFTWEKGSGLEVNNGTSMAYKRKRADELSWDIEDRLEEFPEAPVEIIGRSSGGAVALYALEVLPETVQVENVFLLGSSLPEDYDLTEALKRVKVSLTVFKSPTDKGEGFVVPSGANKETRKLYAQKMLIVPAETSFASADRIEKDFIRDNVAPLMGDWSSLLFGTADDGVYDDSALSLFAE